MSYRKPLPVPDPESAPFWAALKEHRLIVQRCPSTGRYQFPPTSFCPEGLERPEWVEASGRGCVFSWIVVRHPVPRDLYANDVPYVVALVTLEEGCRMASNLVGCAPEEITVDMPVKVAFRDVTPEVTLPVFEPDRE